MTPTATPQRAARARRVAFGPSGAFAVDARRRPRAPRRPRQGLALVLAMTAVAILGAMLADMHESTGTAFAVGVNARDQLQAEYVAKSGLDLTRLLVSQEPTLRALVNPFYQVMFRRPPPQLPVWKVADAVMAPFCDLDRAKAAGAEAGLIFDGARGLSPLPGTCEIVAFAENSKLNLNDPLNLDGDLAKKNVAMQLMALTGGYQNPSPFDPLFNQRDGDGQITTRSDIVTALIDWWDPDVQRTAFDPTAFEISAAGGEEDFYQTLDDPYHVKNAPFDSLEEIRLVRGVSDDFWATFIDPDPEDPDARRVTIYGSGSVNPNEAPPEVLLARLCSFVSNQPLCTDPLEAQKVVQLLRTARMLAPGVPFFTRSADFLAFLEGKGGPRDLYPMLQGMLGEGHPLLFTPLVIPDEMRTEIDNRFVTAAQILTVQSTGVVGNTRVRIRAVVNFHDRWTPPPPNAGSMPTLGVYHHYRVD